jgi:hypothetical protein
VHFLRTVRLHRHSKSVLKAWSVVAKRRALWRYWGFMVPSQTLHVPDLAGPPHLCGQRLWISKAWQAP